MAYILRDIYSGMHLYVLEPGKRSDNQVMNEVHEIHVEVTLLSSAVAFDSTGPRYHMTLCAEMQSQADAWFGVWRSIFYITVFSCDCGKVSKLQ